jgi:hypothetical protein
VIHLSKSETKFLEFGIRNSEDWSVTYFSPSAACGAYIKDRPARLLNLTLLRYLLSTTDLPRPHCPISHPFHPQITQLGNYPSTPTMSYQEPAASGYELTASEMDPAHHAIVPSDDTQDLAFRSIRAIDPRALTPHGSASITPERRTPKGIRPMIWVCTSLSPAPVPIRDFSLFFSFLFFFPHTFGQPLLMAAIDSAQ